MRIRVFHDLEERKNAVRYAFEALLWGECIQFQSSKPPAGARDRHHGVDVAIEYTREYDASAPPNDTVVILASPFFGPDYGTCRVLPAGPIDSLFYPAVGRVPVLFQGPGINSDQGSSMLVCSEGSKASIVEYRRERRVATNLDIVAGAFFMLTRYEELFAGERDEHARFASSASILASQRVFEEPVVDQYTEILHDMIRRIAPQARWKPSPLPKGKTAAVCMTHDVDRVWKWKPKDLRRRARTYLQVVAKVRSARRFARETIGLASDIRSMLSGNPYWSFPQILRSEAGRGLKPCFFFMAAQPGGRYGPDYSLDEREVRELVQQLNQAGCEIALHGSYDSFCSSEMLRSEKKRLEGLLHRSVQGVRQHYLRFKVPDTWEEQEKAGFRYDSTVGFADLEGFRAGTCRPFRVFDVLQDRRLDLWELPVIVMDRTLHQYGRLNAQEAYDRVMRLLELVQRYGGAMVIIWHNSFLADLHDPAWETFYVRTLNLFASEDLLPAVPSEILDLWGRPDQQAESGHTAATQGPGAHSERRDPQADSTVPT